MNKRIFNALRKVAGARLYNLPDYDHYATQNLPTNQPDYETAKSQYEAQRLPIPWFASAEFRKLRPTLPMAQAQHLSNKKYSAYPGQNPYSNKRFPQPLNQNNLYKEITPRAPTTQAMEHEAGHNSH